MTPTRSLALLALLVLFLTACSQTPQYFNDTTLEPQFGTSGYDYAEDVATNSSGDVYVVGRLGHRAFIRRYNASGTLQWERFPGGTSSSSASAVRVDANGNAYVAWSGSGNWLSKYNRSGNLLWKKNARGIHDLAVDSGGNVYAVAGGKGYVTRFNTNGSQAWERFGFPHPQGIAVSSAGNVYVVREDGNVVKYSASGSRIWVKKVLTGIQDLREVDWEDCYEGCDYHVQYKVVTGLNDEFHIVGGVHVGYYDSDRCSRSSTSLNFRRFNKDGAQQAQRVALELSQGYCDFDDEEPYGWMGFNTTTDTLGNTYIATGQCCENSAGTDAVVAKYSRSGVQTWRKSFGTSRFDAATAVASHSGSDVYVVGITDGGLSHANLGRQDAFLRKMDSSGNRVWTR